MPVLLYNSRSICLARDGYVTKLTDRSIFRLLGIPSTVTAILGNPTAVSALENQINNESGFPAWFSTLAPDAQSWVISIAGVAATIIPELVSLEIGAGLTPSGGTGTAPATTSAMTTSYSNSIMTTTSKATTTSAIITTTQGSSSAAPSSSSKAGAAPTGVIAAGVLGAVGFLGVIVAL
jgi:hypothetical protein